MKDSIVGYINTILITSIISIWLDLNLASWLGALLIGTNIYHLLTRK